MISQGAIQRFFKAAAAGTVVLRAGVVGVNFVIMMGLAAVLGLGGFGQLAFLWGIALVLSTVVSLGGPLIILRRMTNGGGMPRRAIVLTAVVYPGALSAALFLPLNWIWPGLSWMAILIVALGINSLSCLSSLLRGHGSVNLSMALRDAGPQVALAVGVLVAGEAALITAGILMGVAAAVVWVLLSRPDTCAPENRVDAASLWGTMILGIGVAQMDLIIGGLFLPPEALGLYAVLRRIANLVAMPVSVATWVSAGPVSAAQAAGDRHRLQEASNAGNRVAFLSGVPLFLAGICGLAFAGIFVAFDLVGVTQIVLCLLLCGALGQVWFASGFTVATLCGFAHLAAFSRAISLVIYTGFGLILGAELSLVTNAAIYVVAMTLGSAVLWLTLLNRLHVDTSAAALWRGKAAQWKPS